jgi:transposase InsO family protein
MVDAIGRGLAAGFAGALAMSVSTNAEMRLRGRPPSDAPARALSRLLGVDASTRRRKTRLALAGHLATSLSLGAARGAMATAGVRPAPAGAALLGLALLPEVLAVPALGAAPPPWRWSATDACVSLLHHGVYAGTTNAVYGLLDRRR